jgi:hypothetical protein
MPLVNQGDAVGMSRLSMKILDRIDSRTRTSQQGQVRKKGLRWMVMSHTWAEGYRYRDEPHMGFADVLPKDVPNGLEQ